ncbi:MAG: hypothetical protein HY931_00350 [Candidatus Falkowbacteria bacterium]|nr:MAG: hypothetical protein HY931_00350 [Candidatus Falkowbacteria bacterium]
MNYSNFYARFYTFLQLSGAAFKRIFKFNFAKVYAGLIIFLQVLAWLQTISIYRRLTGDFTILHYNIDFGVDLIGRPQSIFYYPLLGLGVALLNIVLTAILARRREARLIIHFLMGAALAFAVFLSLALLALNFINFR